MTAQVTVKCGKSALKDAKDGKDTRKDRKDKDVKEFRKESGKDIGDKSLVRDKRPEKPVIDKAVAYDKNWDAKLSDGKLADGYDWRNAPAEVADGGLEPLQARLAALEAAVFGPVEPFIGDELRPDLRDSALSEEPGLGTTVELADKRGFDSPSAG
jgi:hypothetical protein